MTTPKKLSALLLNLIPTFQHFFFSLSNYLTVLAYFNSVRTTCKWDSTLVHSFQNVLGINQNTI